jgi:hypothetical protein
MSQSFILHQFGYTTRKRFMSDSQAVSASSPWGGSEDLGKGFWQQWQQYRDHLCGCYLKWMAGNPTHANSAIDAMRSRAMLKACEKVQKYAGKREY